jgi:hypothetical protein
MTSAVFGVPGVRFGYIGLALLLPSFLASFTAAATENSDRHHQNHQNLPPVPLVPPAPVVAPQSGGGQEPSGNTQAPSCLDNQGNQMAVDNSSAIVLKTSTPNEYLTRVHVSGTVTQQYESENGHAHFGISIGPNPTDTLEMVYNESFGPLPLPTPGMTVEACGDFINSFKATSQYPASPDGAIVHWVHKNPSGHGHPSGYLVMNGLVCGQGNGGSGALMDFETEALFDDFAPGTP